MSADPAVASWREAFAAMDAACTDPAVDAVAQSARFLLLHGHLMPRREQAAMREELEAAGLVDVPVVLAAWHTIAVLCAGAAGPEPQNGAQGDGARSGAAAVANDTNGPVRPAQGGARAIPGPPVAPEGAHSAAESPQAPDAATETQNGPRAATDASAARVAATEDHTDTQEP